MIPSCAECDRFEARCRAMMWGPAFAFQIAYEDLETHTRSCPTQRRVRRRARRAVWARTVRRWFSLPGLALWRAWLLSTRFFR